MDIFLARDSPSKLQHFRFCGVVTTKGALVVPLRRQRMLEGLKIRHYSPTTIRIYLHVAAEFAGQFGKPPLLT
jgi:hypothetical protein